MTHAAEAAEPVHHEPARDVLFRVRAELEEIAGTLDRNQALIASGGGDLARAGPAVLRAVQEADLLSQKVAGIAGFLGALAEALPDGLEIETGRATSRLTLAELVARIGTGGTVRRSHDEIDFGHCDLF